MGSGEDVKGLEEADSPFHLPSVFAEAQAYTRKRSRCLAHGEVEPLNQAGTDGQAKFLEPFWTTKDAFSQGLQSIG
jgi:hypothetical protein